MTGVDLRLGGAVVAAADALAKAFGDEERATVVHVPAKGTKVVEHFEITIGQGDQEIAINVPATAAEHFADCIKELTEGDDLTGVGMSDKVASVNVRSIDRAEAADRAAHSG